MIFRRTLLVALFVLCLAASSARADTVVNPFSGQWNTQLSGHPGTVKFSAISAIVGVPALKAMGGQPCAAPTTYYHGDNSNGPQFGAATMTACTMNGQHLHLIGRWQTPSHLGTFNIALGVNLD